MKEFCEEVLHFTEDAAYKRIQAARKAREFPELFDALADGRLHLSAICMLAPHLTLENAAELIAAATHRGKAQIREWLDRRFPVPELALAPGQVVEMAREVIPDQVAVAGGEPIALLPEAAPEPSRLAPGQVVKTDWKDHWIKLRESKLQYARELSSHEIPSGSASLIVDAAMDLYIRHHEKKKFGATTRPRKPRESQRPGYIPAHVRRKVWEDCGGQCVIICESGKRCGARKFLEFDHIIPLAQGGNSTVENLRLVCRGHNQQLAERAFGAGFMQKKREESQAAKRPSHRDDVIAGLRTLGVSAREAAIVVERSGALQQPTLEESMRAALKCLGPRRRAPGSN
jgi:5-methylcytosine-specific restriction endonuclease McrA